jgi:hypothetical protein
MADKRKLFWRPGIGSLGARVSLGVFSEEGAPKLGISPPTTWYTSGTGQEDGLDLGWALQQDPQGIWNWNVGRVTPGKPFCGTACPPWVAILMCIQE